jgi:hypothetical protein
MKLKHYIFGKLKPIEFNTSSVAINKNNKSKVKPNKVILIFDVNTLYDKK